MPSETVVASAWKRILKRKVQMKKKTLHCWWILNKRNYKTRLQSSVNLKRCRNNFAELSPVNLPRSFRLCFHKLESYEIIYGLLFSLIMWVTPSTVPNTGHKKWLITRTLTTTEKDTDYQPDQFNDQLLFAYRSDRVYDQLQVNWKFREFCER